MRRLLCWIGLHSRERLHFEESGRVVSVYMDCAACGRILAAAQYEMSAETAADHSGWRRPNGDGQ